MEKTPEYGMVGMSYNHDGSEFYLTVANEANTMDMEVTLTRAHVHHIVHSLAESLKNTEPPRG